MPVLQVLVDQQDIAQFRTLGHQLHSQRTLVARCQEANGCVPFACVQSDVKQCSLNTFGALQVTTALHQTQREEGLHCGLRSKGMRYIK